MGKKITVIGSIISVLMLTIIGYYISFEDSTAFNYLWNGQKKSISKFDLITNPILLTLFTSTLACFTTFLNSWFNIRVKSGREDYKKRLLQTFEPKAELSFIYSLFICPFLMILLKPAYFYGGENAYTISFFILAIQGGLFYIICKVTYQTVVERVHQLNRKINF